MTEKKIDRDSVRVTYSADDPGLSLLAELLGVDTGTAASLIAKNQDKRRKKEAARSEQCSTE